MLRKEFATDFGVRPGSHSGTKGQSVVCFLFRSKSKVAKNIEPTQQSFTFFFVICFWCSSCLSIDMDQVLSLELTMISYGCFPFIHPLWRTRKNIKVWDFHGHRGSRLMMVDFTMVDDGKTMKNHMNCLFELLFF